MMNNVLMAVLLTGFAGLSTCIGGLMAFFSKKLNIKFLSFTLGISAGVMVYISFMELLVKAIDELGSVYNPKIGTTMAVGAFFCGILLVALIDRLIPETQIAECASECGMAPEDRKSKCLMRTGVITAVVMGVHNFPEGMATFISALRSPMTAIPIVVAIAIHNIPEGIAVAVPIYYATGSRTKAFLYSALSGMAEPVGAVIGYLILMPFMNETINAIVFAAIAGIMVFISVDELLPAAREYGEHNLSITGLVVGMMVMAVSLIGFM